MKIVTIEPRNFVSLLAQRPRESHKGNFGHLLVMAGSHEKLGAGYLASLAALRVGTGLVTYALPKDAFEKFDARYSEIMCEAIPMEISRALSLTTKKNAVAIGPAMGTEPQTISFIRDFVEHVELPLVIDADGLNALVGKIDILKHRKHPTILTPHPGEMGRLLHMTTAEVQADRATHALKLAREQKVIVVLKGTGTIIATPDERIFINPTGNPGMATAGTGDVLTGVVGGFLAQGVDPFTAALAGVYLHGLAGDLAEKKGEVGLIATDIIAQLPEARVQASQKVSR